MTFKQTIAAFFFALLLCTVNVANVCGQVTVIGHINAEVVESAHASSAMVTGSALKNAQVNAGLLQQDGTYRNTDLLSLGAVTVNAGANIACSIKLHEATLSDSNGNCFNIEPSIINSGRSDTLRADGSQTLLLNGTASLTQGFAPGLYTGSYTVVVLYN